MKLSDLKPGDLVLLLEERRAQRRVVFSTTTHTITLGAIQVPSSSSRRRFSVRTGRELGRRTEFAPPTIEPYNPEEHGEIVMRSEEELWRAEALLRLRSPEITSRLSNDQLQEVVSTLCRYAQVVPPTRPKKGP